MILPIIKYNEVDKLRMISKKIDKKYPNLMELINNMWDTLYDSNGVGLAASQVGVPIRLFIVDASIIKKGYKKVFINPEIELYGKQIKDRESCLSLPKLSVNVDRYSNVKIKYYDKDWNYHEENLDSDEYVYISRIIQHEYDHLDGKLIIDNLSYFSKMKYYIKNNLL
jgi:peptide deformylase